MDKEIEDELQDFCAALSSLINHPERWIKLNEPNGDTSYKYVSNYKRQDEEVDDGERAV